MTLLKIQQKREMRKTTIFFKESRNIQSYKRTSEKRSNRWMMKTKQKNLLVRMPHRLTFSSSNATSLSQQTVLFLPCTRLRTHQAPFPIDQKIIVTIVHWDVTSRYPEGHFVRALGKVESIERVFFWIFSCRIGLLGRWAIRLMSECTETWSSMSLFNATNRTRRGIILD